MGHSSVCCFSLPVVRPRVCSCLSVDLRSNLHNLLSFIVMASENQYVRKIVNSPSYAEPCLVASAKQILEPDNWYAFLNNEFIQDSNANETRNRVFLSGKAHLNYRKGLNGLFTRKAMA